MQDQSQEAVSRGDGVNDTPSTAVKKRAGACLRCRSKKVRCDGHVPECGRCSRANAPCEYPQSHGPREAALHRRIKFLQSLVQEHNSGSVLDLGSSSDQQQPPPPPSPQRQQQQRQQHQQQQVLAEDSGIPSIASQHGQYPLRSSSHNPALRGTTSPGLTYDERAARSPAVLATGGAGQDHSPAVSTHSAISPQGPIAHEVGMLSLANAADPKYIGPSSGITFARLIYASAPHSQGLSIKQPSLAHHDQQSHELPQEELAAIPPIKDLRNFIDAYFSGFHHIYPFLDEISFMKTAEILRRSQLSTVKVTAIDSATQIDLNDHVQLFLVLFLGARMCEIKQGTDLNSEHYLNTAMSSMPIANLHDSIRGLQTLLLLVLSSLHSPHGMNAWFLVSTILAGCIDLGLQRKFIENKPPFKELADHDTRAGIFWSAYSLDRTLCVVLGRPLTLRDEAIDAPYPGVGGSDEMDCAASALYSSNVSGTSPAAAQPSQMQRLTTEKPSTPAIYSFRFDRIVAEIKLMLYRVAQSPSRFPWPTDLSSWQTTIHEVCSKILEDMRNDLERLDTTYGRRISTEAITRIIEIKYHYCIMLLYRPSPGIPRPSALALNFCFESAMETIRIHAELHRSGSLTNSWLDAHSIFISGITICYCLWVSSQVRKVTPASLFAYYANMTKELLTTLSSTWTVAADACRKFDSLVKLTKSLFSEDFITEDIVNTNNEDAGTSNVAMQLDGESGWFAPPNGGSLFDAEIDWSNTVVEYDNTNDLPDEMPQMTDWFSIEGWLNSRDLGS